MWADPELLIADWLHDTLNYKMWADPRLPSRWPFDAPVGHVQRGAGAGDAALTLDSALIDVDFYAKEADNARLAASRAWKALRVDFPGHTWPDGTSVNGVRTVTAPFWSPDPSLFRRSATYRVFLHSPDL